MTEAREMLEEKTERNKRVQRRYDELIAEGKHGHYETMFRVVREECESARQQGREEGLEEAAGLMDAWSENPQALLLAAGEMESQELRTCIAVLKQRATAIRNLKTGE